MEISEKIKNLAKTNAAYVQTIRRHLHKHPELSFQEFKTAKFVKQELENIGIEANFIGKTGLVALIKGKNPDSKTIALRADLDALPIQETNNTDYKSVNEGIMHACGHDVHTSCLIGAAKILYTLKKEFSGTIKLIFQPGEELLPGGASVLIKEGILKNPEVEYIIGQHVQPEMEVGKAGFRPGLYMASTDEIYITIKGKGGHGAMPHTVIDPVLIASHLIIALQQVVSRWSKPALPTVLSFGKVIANGATNVIPDEVKIEGTFRTFDEEWRKDAHRKIGELCENLVLSMGGKVDLEIRNGYPFLKNNAAFTIKLLSCAQEFLGIENVENLDLRTTAEDFAFYTHHVPACFYRLGVGNKAKGITASVHNSNFDIDENALETGSGLMAFLAIQALLIE